jgi:hypothetical protein
VFAFVDESGNTGDNLFDDAQPFFSTLAVATRSDFDKLSGRKVAKLCEQLGVAELHGAELGVARVEEIAPQLLSILKDSDARFALSRVEKRYLLATKMFDAIFDSGENLGAATHIYMIRPLRLLLMFKLAAFVPEELAREFWVAMMAKNAGAAEAGLVKFCADVLAIIDQMPDKGAAERVRQAMSWAHDNPEAIYFHSAGKLMRHGHVPNTVGFGNLLDALENIAKRVGWKIRAIRHDEQSQFEAVLRFWHKMFANASPEAVEVMFGEKFVMQKGYGSILQMVSSTDSFGIQVTDVLLWLFCRLSAKKEIGRESWRLMLHVFRRGRQNDFSFDGVERAALDRFGDMMFAEPPAEKLEEAKRLLTEFEEKRQQRMLEYAEKKAALPSP